MTKAESDCDACLFTEEFSDRPSKPLLTLLVGRKGFVGKIIGGRSVCKRLNELGLVPGTEVEMVNKIANGPVMIRVKGSKLAIGRGLASKVYIILE
jgi:Fe2+ transport system protein FeoA